MIASPLETVVIFHVGPVPITRPVVVTWGIMALLSIGSLLGTRNLRLHPGPWQTAFEVVVETIIDQIRGVLDRDPAPFVPLLGTLFIFLVCANLSAVVPGVEPPTAHIETTGALAGIVFLAVHVFGVRMRGFRDYLKGYTRPVWFMLPLNIVSEFTRTFSLMVRLFGNIMSHEFVIGIVVALAGLLVPVPLMALAVLIGIVQAYIFTVLATVFIGAAVGSIERG
ncbi:MAG: F0F1 ATP synthase subunit A [Alphaproteobacteria bacterium]